MNIKERQSQLIQEFTQLSNWEDRYKRIIEYGRGLKPISEEFKTEDYKVKGCQSQVWLRAQPGEKGQLIFEADSDAMIVKGLIAILLRVYSEATPDEIIDTAPDFVSELGFEKNLSPSRANGLMAMIRQIKYYALGFKALAGRSS